MFHTCGVSTDGDAYCWGGNYAGGLGSASTMTCSGEPCTPTPTRVSGQIRFATVRAGPNHTCGVTPSGLAYCWGLGTGRQLGFGDLPGACASGEQCSHAPLPVFGGGAYKSIATGAGTTCAIAKTGIGYCWGTTDNGMLGLGATIEARTPTAIPNP